MRKLTKEERAARIAAEHHHSAKVFSAWVVDREGAREAPLVEALQYYAAGGSGRGEAVRALFAYDRLDAAPEPTLLEAAKALLDRLPPAIEVSNLASALKAAVERAEREGKP